MTYEISVFTYPSIHSWFPNSTKQLQAFQRKLRVPASCEFSLKLSLAYSEMDESTLTHVYAFQREKSYSWSESEMKQIANRFLVSFFCKLLPNLLAETLLILRHYCGIFPQNFSWCQLSAEQKFSRESFCSLLKIRKNRESFLTVKLLSFKVCMHLHFN